MSESREERRESKRTFFTLKNDISATIQTYAESPVSISVTIIGVSAGGFSFSCSREKVLDIIKEGDLLTVTDIKTPQPLGPIASLEVEVKYVLDYEAEKRMLFGCTFTKVSDALRNKIQSFVEFRQGSADAGDKS